MVQEQEAHLKGTNATRVQAVLSNSSADTCERTITFTLSNATTYPHEISGPTEKERLSTSNVEWINYPISLCNRQGKIFFTYFKLFYALDL